MNKSLLVATSKRHDQIAASPIVVLVPPPSTLLVFKLHMETSIFKGTFGKKPIYTDTMLTWDYSRDIST